MEDTMEEIKQKLLVLMQDYYLEDIVTALAEMRQSQADACMEVREGRIYQHQANILKDTMAQLDRPPL